MRDARFDQRTFVGAERTLDEEAQIVVELVFGFEAHNHAVDPVLTARIGEAKIGGVFAGRADGRGLQGCQ